MARIAVEILIHCWRFEAARRRPLAVPRPPRIAFAPRRCEQPGTLHLMQGRINGALFQLKRLRAAAFGLLHHFIGVHGALAE
jgi:hypothetical protein